MIPQENSTNWRARSPTLQLFTGSQRRIQSMQIAMCVSLTSPIFVGEIPMFIVGLVQPTHLSSTPNSIHPPQGFSEILEISTTSRSSWRSPGSRTCRWRCRRARRTAPRCCCEPPRAPSVPRRRWLGATAAARKQPAQGTVGEKFSFCPLFVGEKKMCWSSFCWSCYVRFGSHDLWWPINDLWIILMMLKAVILSMGVCMWF